MQLISVFANVQSAKECFCFMQFLSVFAKDTFKCFIQFLSVFANVKYGKERVCVCVCVCVCVD